MKHVILKLALIAILFSMAIESGSVLFSFDPEIVAYCYESDNNEEDNQESKGKENEQESEQDKCEDKILRAYSYQSKKVNHSFMDDSIDKSSIYFRTFQGIDFHSEVLMPPEASLLS